MGILLLKKRVNCDKCSFATKQRMFGVFAIDEILCYRGTRFPGSRTLCHLGHLCSDDDDMNNDDNDNYDDDDNYYDDNDYDADDYNDDDDDMMCTTA